MNIADKIKFINSNVPTVKFNENLDLISNAREREIKCLKRVVQDCISTIECEGFNQKSLSELDKYVTELYDQLKSEDSLQDTFNEFDRLWGNFKKDIDTLFTPKK